MWDDDELGSPRSFSVDGEEITSEDSPERELLRAILRATLTDLQGSGLAARKARFYMLAEDDSYILSFNNLCRMLELDPEWIRRLAGVTEIKQSKETRASVRAWYAAD